MAELKPITKVRKAALLKQGYMVIDWFGTLIRLRLSDGCLSSTDILMAESRRVGRRFDMRDFLRLKTHQSYLQALAKKRRNRLFSDDLGDGPFLIERAGKGGLEWVVEAVALKLSAWLNPDLEVAIYEFTLVAREKAHRTPVMPKLPPHHTANDHLPQVIQEQPRRDHGQMDVFSLHNLAAPGHGAGLQQRRRRGSRASGSAIRGLCLASPAHPPNVSPPAWGEARGSVRDAVDLEGLSPPPRPAAPGSRGAQPACGGVPLSRG